MLERVCKQYYQDKEVVDLVMKAFAKLFTNGHLLLWEDISEEDKMILRRATVSYYIPWDIAFKSSNLSSPARPTFNASKNTPNGGTNLNDILVRGVPNLVSLVQMILGWICGPDAISGDIKLFYNSVLLAPEHLPYQRFLFKEGLNPEAKTVEAVIKTLIYSVRLVSAQSEVLIEMITEEVEEKYPQVATFL